MHGLKLAGIDLNRKILAEMAIHDEAGFTQLTTAAKTAIEAQPAPVAPAAE